MLVTYPSAMFTTKAVFGKGNSNLFNKLGINSNKVNEIQKRLKDINKFKSGLKSAGREFLEGVGQESFQEFSQFAIQDYASLKGKLQTNDDFIDGIMKGYKEAFTTVEGLKSGFLGGLMGGVTGAIKGYKDRQKELEHATKLSKIINEAGANFIGTINEFYKKDEQGKIIIEDGIAQMELEKVNNLIEKNKEEFSIADALIINKLQNNTLVAKQIATDELIKDVLPLLDTEGALDLYIKNINDNYDTIDTDAVLFGFKDKNEYKDYIFKTLKSLEKNYTDIKNNGIGYFGVNIN